MIKKQAPSWHYLFTSCKTQITAEILETEAHYNVAGDIYRACVYRAWTEILMLELAFNRTCCEKPQFLHKVSQ